MTFLLPNQTRCRASVWINLTCPPSPGWNRNLLSLGIVQGQCSPKDLQGSPRDWFRVSLGAGAEWRHSDGNERKADLRAVLYFNGFGRASQNKNGAKCLGGLTVELWGQSGAWQRSGNLNLMNKADVLYSLSLLFPHELMPVIRRSSWSAYRGYVRIHRRWCDYQCKRARLSDWENPHVVYLHTTDSFFTK